MTTQEILKTPFDGRDCGIESLPPHAATQSYQSWRDRQWSSPHAQCAHELEPTVQIWSTHDREDPEPACPNHNTASGVEASTEHSSESRLDDTGYAADRAQPGRATGSNRNVPPWGHYRASPAQTL